MAELRNEATGYAYCVVMIYLPHGRQLAVLRALRARGRNAVIARAHLVRAAGGQLQVARQDLAGLGRHRTWMLHGSSAQYDTLVYGRSGNSCWFQS